MGRTDGEQRQEEQGQGRGRDGGWDKAWQGCAGEAFVSPRSGNRGVKVLDSSFFQEEVSPLFLNFQLTSATRLDYVTRIPTSRKQARIIAVSGDHRHRS